MYVAMVGTSIVETTETLAEMRVILAELCRHNDTGEDVVVWEDNKRVVLVITHDGRNVEMDGASLTWTWTPTPDQKQQPA